MTHPFFGNDSRRAEIGLFTGWFLLMVLGFFYFHRFQLDDMFITLRYARNFALGEGFAFNPGEAYYGFTSMLHFFAMAALYLLFPVDALFPNLCIFAGCLSLWTTAILVYLMARDYGKPLWGALGGTLLLMSEHIYATIGLDSIWCLTLAMGGLHAEYRKRICVSPTLLGLATLARPDAVILAGLVFVRRLVLERRLSWRALLIYSGVVLSWHGFAWIYFGHPLPQTLGAKMEQGVTSLHFSRDFVYPWLYPTHFYPLQYGAFFLPLGLLALLRFRRDHPFTLVSLWSILHTFLYFHFLKVPTDYPWYYVLPSAAALLWMAIGIGVLLELAGSLLDRIQKLSERRTPFLQIPIRTAWMLKAGGMVSVVLFLLSGWGEVGSAYRKGRSYFHGYWSAGPECREAGLWIRDHTPEDIVVMASDIGAVGYYSERYIWDLCDLIHNPDVRSRKYEGFEYFRMYPNQGFEYLIEEKEGCLLETVEFQHESNPPAVFISRAPSGILKETPQTALAK